MAGLITRRRLVGLIAATVSAGAASSIATAADGARLTVVATTGMIADAARRVGDDHVTVKALMGSGVDPHAYRQTRSDIVALSKADLVLRHGLYLEAQLETFLDRLAKRQTVVAVGEAVPKDQLIAHDDYADKFDPHVWMSPDLWVHVVEAVRDALIAKRPKPRRPSAPICSAM